MAENPDVIVVASGSSPARPPIPGIDNPKVVNVLDVDSGRKKLSGKVLVCGGGVSGCESGLALAMEGCEVTIVDMIPVSEFASDVMDLTRKNLFHLLKEYKVKLVGERLVRSIDDQGVVVEGKDWKYETLEADYVVEALGMKSNNALAEKLKDLLPDVYVVGDAYEVKNIKRANLTAYDYSCNI
jgi:2-enoate reductase